MNILLAALVMMVWAWAALAGSPDGEAGRAGRATVEPAAVSGLLGAGEAPSAGARVVVLDVRKAEDFEAGRLRGAVRVDLDEWNKEIRARASVGEASAWAGRLGAMGLTGSERVLVYDEGGMTHAAAVWFLLQQVGVTDIAVINGGWKHLEKALPASLVASGPAEPVRAREFVPSSDAPALVGWASKEDVKAVVESGSASVFDARTPEEYAGKNKRNNARGGHLPGAVNLSHTELFTEDGLLRPADELRTMLAARGFEKGKRIVTHCQGGGRAALAALAAVQAGFGPVDNYYMSFGEWAADETCKVETP